MPAAAGRWAKHTDLAGGLALAVFQEDGGDKPRRSPPTGRPGQHERAPIRLVSCRGRAYNPPPQAGLPARGSAADVARRLVALILAMPEAQLG